MSWLVAVSTLSALTLLLATLLALASRLLRVAVDPRLEQIEALLPGANCGACGQPGCQAFARALLRGDTQPGACTLASAAQADAVARLLGVSVQAVARKVARLACAGGRNVARPAARYVGLPTCAAAAVVAGGGRACPWGCLGHGDCAVACRFEAIHMNRHRLPVVDEALCTACGDCVTACPRTLFTLVEQRRHLWVACRSRESADAVLAACTVGCTACGRCAADAPGVLSMQDALPLVDARAAQTRAAIERCPTGAIVWIDAAGVHRGQAAATVVRESALELPEAL